MLTTTLPMMLVPGAVFLTKLTCRHITQLRCWEVLSAARLEVLQMRPASVTRCGREQRAYPEPLPSTIKNTQAFGCNQGCAVWCRYDASVSCTMVHCQLVAQAGKLKRSPAICGAKHCSPQPRSIPKYTSCLNGGRSICQEAATFKRSKKRGTS